MNTRGLVPAHIEALKPYVPGKPLEELERELGITDAIKLASNENPLGPSPKAMAAMRDGVAGLHYYPDATAFELRRALSAYLDVPAAEIVVGNGSNEILTIIARTFAEKGDTAVISEQPFAAYRVILGAEGIPYTAVPRLRGHRAFLDGMLDVVDESTKFVFLANPTNPTGTYVKADDLESFLRALPERVIPVIDEAYLEFVTAADYRSVMTMRGAHDRLVLTRTFSKAYGLAGIRLGYGVADREMTAYMNRVREPFDCNILAQRAGAAALTDVEFLARTTAMTRESRALFEAGLHDLVRHGVSWTPSQTNFLLVKTPHEGVDLYEELLHSGVIIRPLVGQGLPREVRITLGTPSQMARCLGALEHTLMKLERG